MKRLLVALLCSSLMSCFANTKPRTAPVRLAYDLYAGCIMGTVMSAHRFTTTSEVDEYVQWLDEYCLTWTVVWYGPMQGGALESLTEDEATRFAPLRVSILSGLTTELLTANGLKRRKVK
jgi:hypothetical protein